MAKTLLANLDFVNGANAPSWDNATKNGYKSATGWTLDNTKGYLEFYTNGTYNSQQTAFVKYQTTSDNCEVSATWEVPQVGATWNTGIVVGGDAVSSGSLADKGYYVYIAPYDPAKTSDDLELMVARKVQEPGDIWNAGWTTTTKPEVMSFAIPRSTMSGGVIGLRVRVTNMQVQIAKTDGTLLCLLDVDVSQAAATPYAGVFGWTSVIGNSQFFGKIGSLTVYDHTVDAGGGYSETILFSDSLDTSNRSSNEELDSANWSTARTVTSDVVWQGPAATKNKIVGCNPRHITTSNSGSTLVSGFTPSMPSSLNLKTGELMLMYVLVGAATITTPPTGWTAFDSNTATSGAKLYTYFKYATSNIEAAPTISLSGASMWACAVVVFPPDASLTSHAYATSANATSLNTPSKSIVTKDGPFIIACASYTSGATGATFTTPSGFTAIANTAAQNASSGPSAHIRLAVFMPSAGHSAVGTTISSLVSSVTQSTTAQMVIGVATGYVNQVVLVPTTSGASDESTQLFALTSAANARFRAMTSAFVVEFEHMDSYGDNAGLGEIVSTITAGPSRHGGIVVNTDKGSSGTPKGLSWWDGSAGY